MKFGFSTWFWLKIVSFHVALGISGGLTRSLLLYVKIYTGMIFEQSPTSSVGLPTNQATVQKSYQRLSSHYFQSNTQKLRLHVFSILISSENEVFACIFFIENPSRVKLRGMKLFRVEISFRLKRVNSMRALTWHRDELILGKVSFWDGVQTTTYSPPFLYPDIPEYFGVKVFILLHLLITEKNIFVLQNFYIMLWIKMIILYGIIRFYFHLYFHTFMIRTIYTNKKI